MDSLIRKKIVLSLLDSTSKSANEISNEIDESLAKVEHQLTVLVSENICEKINQDEVSQYVVKKDIETFAQLVKEFLSKKKEHREELFANLDEKIGQFITSEYYFTRIDNQLVDYVLKRVHSDLVCQTEEEQEQLRRILLASPSSLFFVLHGDRAIFSQMYSSWNQLDPSDSNRDWIIQRLLHKLRTLLLEMLIADVRNSTYISLYINLQIRVVRTRLQVELATPGEKYLEGIESEAFSFCRLDEESSENLHFGQSVTYIDPIDFSDDGLALLNLGMFQNALDSFDKALNAVQNLNQKAIVLNNKGLAFLRLKQYQKGIECFEEGIVLDSKGEIPELRDNKQLADKYLIQTTDTDDLTQPTQVPFVQGLPVPFAETRFYEFKEVVGGNAARSIADTSDVYAVAFLNREGGRIFWGVRNNDRTTVGVTLDERQRDDVRRKVSEKLGATRPPISVDDWALEFHSVDNLQGEVVEDLWVIELVVSCPQKRDIFYTSRGELHVKTEGGKKKLLGTEVTEFIRRHFQNNTETG